MVLKNPLRVLAFGDSITEGTYGGATPYQTYPYLLQQLLNQQDILTEVINAGIPGETAPEGLARLKAGISYYQPNLILLMHGANDSFVVPGFSQPTVPLDRFIACIREMVLLSEETKITPVLMTTTPFANSIYFNDEPFLSQGVNFMIEKYVDAVRRIAADLNVVLIDHFETWKELDNETLNAYLPDGVHPGARGNRLIANTILSKLI